MDCIVSTLMPKQIEAEIPHPTGVDAPTVSSSINLLESTLSVLGTPGIVSVVRRIVNNTLSKCHGSALIPGFGEEYFNEIYVLPVSIDVGVILSQVQVTMTIHSSFRLGIVQWTTYDGSAAGVGVTLGPPLPPINLLALSSSTNTLTIDLVGPPSIDADLVFDFLNPSLVAVQILVPIVGRRSVLFPYQPEAPITETLEWVTYIRNSSNGEEQRSSGRDVPRSTHKLRFRTDNEDIRTLENTLFDGQTRAFGIPVWFQSTGLTETVAIGATVINVKSTTFLGAVVGESIMLWSSSSAFESAEVAEITEFTITVTSGFLAEFLIDALVMPILNAVLVTPVDGSRFRVNVKDFSLDFVVRDNGASLADTSAFSSYTPTGGLQRVLLDDDNFLDGETINEQFQRDIEVVDNKVSFPEVFTNQVVSRETSQKGFFTNSPLALSNVRKLLHALAGRRVSFYLPSGQKDLVSLASISPADQALTVVSVDYVNLVRQRQPRNVVRVVPKIGTPSDPKLVTGSDNATPGQETISIAGESFGVTIALADIDRIEYVKKSRFDTDRIEIQHLNSHGKAAIYIPVVTVLEGDV